MGSVSFCFVSTFYPPHGFGGDAVHVHRLANGLARRGHRVRVVHSPTAYRMLAGAIPPQSGLEDHPSIEVLPAYEGKGAAAGTYLTGRPLGYRARLESLVRGFDVVHFHNPSLAGAAGALGIGDALSVYTAHEHWLLCPTHVLFRNGREVCTTRTCWRCTIRQGRPPQLWRSTGILGRAVGRLDLLLCPSRFTAELHRREYPDVRIEVLPTILGPDPDRLADPPPAPAADRPYFLYAGRLERIKGVDRLVAAFREVRGADLLIAGDGTQAAPLRTLAAGNPAVRFLGHVPHPEVLGLCRGARALVVPSAGYESFGGVAAEAMAFGTPAVVRALGALPELVAGGGGLAFATDVELAAILQRLTDRPEAAASMGERAREVFAERWAEPVVFERYLSLIADAAAGSGRERLADTAAAAAARERTPERGGGSR